MAIWSRFDLLYCGFDINTAPVIHNPLRNLQHSLQLFSLLSCVRKKVFEARKMPVFKSNFQVADLVHPASHFTLILSVWCHESHR